MRSRNGFTLVELLVVISLMLILAAIGIAVFPTASSSQREARGAADVHGWLRIAKQRALRNNAPYGVRFYVDANGMVSDAAYIEDADNLWAGMASALVASGKNVTLLGAPGFDFTNGQTADNHNTILVLRSTVVYIYRHRLGLHLFRRVVS